MKNSTFEVKKSSVLILRMMLSGIFIVASLNHFFNMEKTVARIEQANFGAIGQLLGPPEVAVIASGIVMISAGIALLIGFKTRWAAILLLLVLIPITLTIQVGQVQSMGPLFKNIGLAGGLLFFAMNDLKFRKTSESTIKNKQL
ncbi:DoxX family protein [Brumimicrobium sp.]|uniref:DoxX family protein n=1 Tax=Brumimicrobium sp. TaxID=2029867 RepID=UPI003A8DA3DE